VFLLVFIIGCTVSALLAPDPVLAQERPVELAPGEEIVGDYIVGLPLGAQLGIGGLLLALFTAGIGYGFYERGRADALQRQLQESVPKSLHDDVYKLADGALDVVDRLTDRLGASYPPEMAETIERLETAAFGRLRGWLSTTFGVEIDEEEGEVYATGPVPIRPGGSADSAPNPDFPNG